jgi:hypothetical protein
MLIISEWILTKLTTSVQSLYTEEEILKVGWFSYFLLTLFPSYFLDISIMVL